MSGGTEQLRRGFAAGFVFAQAFAGGEGFGGCEFGDVFQGAEGGGLGVVGDECAPVLFDALKAGESRGYFGGFEPGFELFEGEVELIAEVE